MTRAKVFIGTWHVGWAVARSHGRVWFEDSGESLPKSLTDLSYFTFQSRESLACALTQPGLARLQRDVIFEDGWDRDFPE